MQRFILTLLSICLLITAGCASQNTLSQTDRARISTIALNKSITVPDDMWYTGPEAGFGLLGVLVESATSSTEDQLLALAQKNDIQIDRILADEFERQLVKQSQFKVADARQAGFDARIDIKLEIYGLALRKPFSSELMPMLRFTAVLTDKEGKTVWQQTEHFSNRDIEGITLEQIKADPEQLKRIWELAAKTSVGNMLGKL